MSLARDLARHGLTVLARTVHEDGRALALVGPDGGAMWPVFAASAEAADGASDPLDRWSRRVLGAVAAAHGGEALFPFGGPPWHPFIAWALRSGRLWASPVTLLVHDRQGLFVSFRGALALPGPHVREAAAKPCDACKAPCRTACPVDALGPDGYDVAACRAHVASPAGVACRQGCLVRRACPVGRGLRPAEQSAFHMRAFMGS